MILSDKPKGKPGRSSFDALLIVVLLLALVIAGALIAAVFASKQAGPNLFTASVPLQLGSVLLDESFDTQDAWEYYEEEAIFLRVEDGRYRMTTGSNGYIWGLNDFGHSNVMIEVETKQLSAELDNAYGVMCRADRSNNGDGYYFFISGDGFYSIRYAVNNAEFIDPLVEYAFSDAINQGQAHNHIRAVCADNYLALWVNDELVAETRDGRISGGYAGLAAAVFSVDYEATDIAFDKLTITEVSIAP